MKRYGFLLVSIVIAFFMLTSNLLVSSASSSQNNPYAAINTPTRTPTRAPSGPSIKTVIKQSKYFGPTSPGPREEALCRNLESPILVNEQAEVRQLDSLELTTCGWNNPISATITKPDGTIYMGIPKYFPGGIWELHYTPTSFDPTGNYKISFSNGEKTLDAGFNVTQITEPGVVIIAEDREIQIYNFHPYEKISVYQYDKSSSYTFMKKTVTWTLNSWQELEMGSEGKLRMPLIDTREPYQVTYVVIGEETGEYNTDRGETKIASILNTDTSVSGDSSLCSAMKSRLALGAIARVTTPARIRENPTTSARIIRVLPKDTLFLVTEGPQCSNGYTWWYGITPISFGDGFVTFGFDLGSEGWVAESDKGIYLLKPSQ